MVYAKRTMVSSEKSRMEIERTLQRYGADAFGYAVTRDQAEIKFRWDGKVVRLRLRLPDSEAEEFQNTPTGLKRHGNAAHAEWEKACRQRWRVLALVIKAKLEGILAGITTFEEEFLAFLVLPDNRTVGEFILPQIEAAYELGDMPAMLTGGES